MINSDPRGWLVDQLKGPPRLPEIFRELPDSSHFIVQSGKIRSRTQVGRGERNTVKEFRNWAKFYYSEHIHARFTYAALTDFPFHERLVQFWTNHFAISADKRLLSVLAGAFENEAIRPNLNGSFYDLLRSVEQHPAMILYLDNDRSIGPNSRFANRASIPSHRARFGMNENFSREILELHTLGVDGGYTQKDVRSFARVITGWSIGSVSRRQTDGSKSGGFSFRRGFHEPGTHLVMGKRYPQTGVAQGEAVLRDLSRHQSTSKFIATKLCRHFVGDIPPTKMVDRIAAIFLETDGDLPSIHKALVDSDEPWEKTFAKYKTPKEFVVSTYRAFNSSPKSGQYVLETLGLMGQTPFKPGSPAGWPDSAEHWDGADALYKRIQWSVAVAREVKSDLNPVDLGGAVLGPAFGEHSKSSIASAESVRQGLALLLLSPEFQRR